MKIFLAAFLLLGGWQGASAFSLLGPFNTTWQTQRLGIALIVNAQIGGPMNLGEEYRWNVPIIYYAVDGAFLDFFGARGRDEIDKAMRILNDLPAASQINLDDYPLKSERANYRAQALGLIDLKSLALATVLEELGLAAPSRFVFTLRERFIGPGAFPTNYLIIKRNFDPVTFEPTSYINGDLWTYTGVIDDVFGDGTTSEVSNSRVDPLAYGNPVADRNEGFTSFGAGSFYTGLTRDDVGGLRYIYRSDNRNVENAITNAFGSAFGGGPILSSGGNANGSPWEPFFLSTNGTTTIIGGGANSPWSPVAVNTNTTAQAGGGVVGGIVTTNAFVNAGLRGGVEKLNFVRVDFDSLLGQFVAPVLDSFNDTVFTNNTRFTQTLQRIITLPDILFTAGDLEGSDQQGLPFVFYARTTASSWQNNAVINNRRSAADSGPGNVEPTIIITLNNLGPRLVNRWPFFLDEASAVQLVTWGSFDGTTNEPIVYPSGVSIQDLERLVLGGR